MEQIPWSASRHVRERFLLSGGRIHTLASLEGGPLAVLRDGVGAGNLCHLGRCPADGDRLGLALDVGRASLSLAGGGMIFGLWA